MILLFLKVHIAAQVYFILHKHVFQTALHKLSFALNNCSPQLELGFFFFRNKDVKIGCQTPPKTKQLKKKSRGEDAQCGSFKLNCLYAIRPFY